ncbi:Membrane proteinase PrsW, cleaves anti-sigma factor RsiW, M82 family [Lachnospiraceae bacterium G11]|nr:Membrane proteinase PrsW, cleaves anti-sigma factor RsiW, M82 family [Lachnospiraceae bacterium G11]
MNYIENVFICLVAPLLISVFWMKGKARRLMIFLIIGMGACLLSSYISTFLAIIQGADFLSASLEIAPLVEESIKLFPLLFYLLIFEPEAKDAANASLMTAIGFATFENVCFLMENGADSVLHLLIRGFGTGTCHVVCALFISIGIYRLWDKEWLRNIGTLALLAVAITYHGIFNILVSASGAIAIIGYFIPIATIIVTRFFRKELMKERA